MYLYTCAACYTQWTVNQEYQNKMEEEKKYSEEDEMMRMIETAATNSSNDGDVRVQRKRYQQQ